jgi:LasA protease
MPERLDSMSIPTSPNPIKLILAAFIVIIVALLACARSANQSPDTWSVSGQNPLSNQEPVQTPGPGNPHNPSSVIRPFYTPTPDQPRVLPTMRIETETHVVRSGDTLGQIAQRYSVSLEKLIQENGISNPNLLSIGQQLTIPPPDPGPPGPAFKIIPDSELVYGPASVDFDIEQFVREKNGYLAGYSEEVDDKDLSGAKIVERISYEYSINPRLLLAVLDYRSGWVTKNNPDEETIDFPMGVKDNTRKGLYRQLAWAANFLNRGYYLWRVNGVGAWLTASDDIIPIDPSINAGTAAVQHMFSLLLDRNDWERAVGEKGVFSVYINLFGYPFDRAVEPLLPANLAQPLMQLPFEYGKVWRFTGGPHGGWGSGSGWAALDFAPPSEVLGCTQSDEWVVAVADGIVVRSGDGAVVQDLHGDGLEQTGWTVLYFHIETRNRVEVGTYLKAGERIGHPSCEGGYSTGTHLHIARRFNGEWIPADQVSPFVLDGWVSSGTGREYNGYLIKEGRTLEAYAGRSDTNSIQR